MIQIISPTGLNVIRDDAQGMGHFGASRGFRSHKGVDLLVRNRYDWELFSPIFMPLPGRIKKKCWPYKFDRSYRGCVIESDGGIEIKIFYVGIFNHMIKKDLDTGMVIGYAQNIALKYNTEKKLNNGLLMKNHIHLEVRLAGKTVDPFSIFEIKNFNE